LPEATFEPYEPAGGYWVSRAPVDPLEVVELGDLVDLHERSGIELRAVERLRAFWDAVAASSLEYSGIRLRNARLSA
jgi:hypothetical protein